SVDGQAGGRGDDDRAGAVLDQPDDRHRHHLTYRGDVVHTVDPHSDGTAEHRAGGHLRLHVRVPHRIGGLGRPRPARDDDAPAQVVENGHVSPSTAISAAPTTTAFAPRATGSRSTSVWATNRSSSNAAVARASSAGPTLPPSATTSTSNRATHPASARPSVSPAWSSTSVAVGSPARARSATSRVLVCSPDARA